MIKEGKDLTQEAPRSPKERILGFAVIARTIDKCRAKLWGNIGEYHFDCPLDNMLFGFKGIKGDDFKDFVQEGRTDEEIAHWVKENGESRTDAEIKAWSDASLETYYVNDPEKSEWFRGECERLGLDPETTTLFDMLDVDDAQAFAK
ncbi:MAG TPA: DUF5069 domain-containing protein [Candidatus Paceibacterota bacterium]